MSHGSICHIEFPTTDIARSKAFYESVFGWKVNLDTGFPDYALFSTPKGVGGGFNAAEAPAATGPVVHIEVEEIEDTLAKIVEAGGKTVTPKTKICEEAGSFAIFLDNVGNRIALWSAA